MPTLRLLLALSLIASGTTGAALSISGYFGPQPWQAEGKAAAAAKPKLEMAVLKPRQRFVAVEAKPKPSTAGVASTSARPKTNVAKPAAAKKPAPSKDDANQQQAAVWWPLSNLFKN